MLIKIWYFVTILVLSKSCNPSLGPNTNIPDKILNAMEQCRNAIARNPKHDEKPNGPSFCLGLLHMRIGQHERALTNFIQAEEKCPEGFASFHAGECYEKLLRFADAESSYKRCYHKCDDIEGKKTVIYRLSPLLLRLQKSKDALQILHSHLKIDPENIKVKELIGASYHADKNFEAAFKTYESLIPLTNYSLQSYLNAASAAGDFDHLLILI